MNWGDPVVYPHAGPHRADLVGHLGEVAGPYTGDGLHLGRRLHLEYADGVGPVEHGVHLPVLEVDAAQVYVCARAFFDELKGILHLGEGAQGQEVDLHEAAVVDTVLVPVAYVASVDGRLLDGHHIYEGAGADDHSSRVLGQVLGEAVKLEGQVYEVSPHGGVHLVPELGKGHHLGHQTPGAVEVRPLGQGVHVLEGEAQGLAQVPHGSLELVGADHPREGCVVPAPPLVDPL